MPAIAAAAEEQQMEVDVPVKEDAPAADVPVPVVQEAPPLTGQQRAEANKLKALEIRRQKEREKEERRAAYALTRATSVMKGERRQISIISCSPYVLSTFWWLWCVLLIGWPA